ncbi:Uncharacterised protein [Yersinia pseudotuberculosis]|nr:Uncharacterized protein YP598_1174 [Yersinia pseudotuberculosis]CFV23450.1 Uncharacterised protein [Yersinia pseudotuberculosis]CNH61293.1 Uncharacterised protein [Yersinia pseudotuberculosis]CNK38164.1 Uncharacterised protein [Yersinia pseudotuberculosis]CNK94452.1 Uncharacterised protein [Yersinia pseudotuberculosis]
MMMLTVWDQQPLKKSTLLAASAFFVISTKGCGGG